MSTLLLNPRQMYAPDPEQQPAAAGVLTVGVHIVFAVVLFLNMSWQQNIRSHASVKLWTSIPTTSVKDKSVKTERQTRPKPVAPAKPEIQPAPEQVTKSIPQPASVTIAPAVAPPPTPSPSPVVDIPQPVTPQIAPPRAELAAPARERVDKPATERPNTVAAAPSPSSSPVVDIPQPVTPQMTPPRAELAAPARERVDKPATERPNTVAAAPPPVKTPTQFQEQPDRKPEVDVDSLRRDRALALAERLREEESSRLNETVDRERTARDEESRKRREERERKLARELQEISLAAEQRRAEQDAQQAQKAAARGIADDYRARISAKIRQRVILPPDLRGNPEAIYEVSLLPGGEVTQVRLLQSSGVLTYDAAVERAILAAQPLPVPEDPELFHANFKNFLLSFRPKE
jgi:colicin import membrane protein